MARNLKPVSVAGIEFDALIDETKTLSATIPAYPVEDGFNVADHVSRKPLTLQMIGTEALPAGYRKFATRLRICG